ncbi:hypothetical protein K443DRAFT_14813 [Laccaria amethystina LaAM-08-1]|uniref:Alpha-type protein kinase domain-containing protein n=1 Tax=Laccaria amethystina LaAM-08-1 TaxID=1095629 RepID=A0A0C9WHC2_9AGAR|nr:hypothetical protein K443DRAFT_14813 [Laccaria amethystina LaAM-08-1]
MTICGVNTLVLFDPMSHSKQSYVAILWDSGIGDHGPDRIETFTTQHHCNDIYCGLKLTSPLEEEKKASDNEDVNED